MAARDDSARAARADEEVKMLTAQISFLEEEISSLRGRLADSPRHSHALEEEVFLVWEGTPTIRTPRGEFECRRGDVIAFPPGDVGMHQLCNKSDAPCTVFLLGNAEPNHGSARRGPQLHQLAQLVGHP